MMRIYRSLLMTYLKPQRRRVFLLAGLMISGAVLQLVNPQLVRQFIDTTQAGAGQTALVAGLLFILVALAHSGLRLASVYLSKDIGWQATNALRADLTQRLLSLDLSFHKTHTPGELIERVDGDVTSLANFFSDMVISVIWNGMLILGILGLLYREDWRIGVGLTVYAGLTLFALGLLQNVGSNRWLKARQARAEMSAFVEERITGTEDIRGNGAEAYVMRRLYPLMRSVMETERPAHLLSQFTYVTTRFLFVLGYAIGLALGVYLFYQGAVTLGAAYLIVIYIGMLASPLEDIRAQAQDLQQAAASIQRIQGLFGLQSRIEEQPRAVLPPGPLAVAFENVSFEYDDIPAIASRPLASASLPSASASLPLASASLPLDLQSNGDNEDGGGIAYPAGASSALPSASASLPLDLQSNGDSDSGGGIAYPTGASDAYVLRDLSFHLHPGQTLGLLGRTGSGKTTLTRLLFRLYDPNAGVIRLGGMDIRQVALANLRASVGMVTQDVQLFQASIRDNLTFFNRQVSDAQLKHALRELDLWDWITSLPQGLDTRLGAGGRGLSAGEAQLLAFTRVLLKDPGLVILDEASSRLDPVTERRLEQATTRLLANRTGLVIAHRLHTVQRVDHILILEAGEVVEAGPRRQLVADPTSRFYQLLQTGLEETLV